MILPSFRHQSIYRLSSHQFLQQCRFSSKSLNTNFATKRSDPLTSTVTPLQSHLRNMIRFGGPMSIADYMRHCLTHPQYGYYTNSKRPIFGKHGDFITSPQISIVFSEMIAVWIAHFVHNTLDSQDYDLIELGPGTGDLIKTALPSLTKLNASPKTTTLVDTSETLSCIQQNVLKNTQSASVTSSSSTLDEALSNIGTSRPTIFIAHELFDALPVHVFNRINSTTWRERLITADDTSNRLRLALSPIATPALSLFKLIPKVDDSMEILEVCAQGLSLVETLGKRIESCNGAALIIDYGGREMITKGDSVRAISKHEQVDLLHRPGECDITADVNFDHLKHVVNNIDQVEMKGIVRQREFLLKLGVAERFRVIARTLIKEEEEESVLDKKLEQLQRDYERLVGVEHNGMGDVYKVAAVVREDTTQVAGF